MIRSSITDNELTRTCALTRSLELLFSFTYTSLRKQTDRELRETTPSDGENYAPIFAFRSAVAPRSLSLRTTTRLTRTRTPAWLTSGSLSPSSKQPTHFAYATKRSSLLA